VAAAAAAAAAAGHNATISCTQQHLQYGCLCDQLSAPLVPCVVQAEVFAVAAARSERVVTTGHDHTCR
jgi:hypothetical protein